MTFGQPYILIYINKYIMDFELLLNRHKQKKQVTNQTKFDEKIKTIIDIIDSIDENDIKMERTKIKSDNIIDAFKTFIISYSNLKKQMSIENDKHNFIISIVNNIIKKSLGEIELLSKSTNNKNLKKITNCILENNDKKTIKLNIIKS